MTLYSADEVVSSTHQVGTQGNVILFLLRKLYPKEAVMIPFPNRRSSTSFHTSPCPSPWDACWALIKREWSFRHSIPGVFLCVLFCISQLADISQLSESFPWNRWGIWVWGVFSSSKSIIPACWKGPGKACFPSQNVGGGEVGKMVWGQQHKLKNDFLLLKWKQTTGFHSFLEQNGKQKCVSKMRDFSHLLFLIKVIL